MEVYKDIRGYWGKSGNNEHSITKMVYDAFQNLQKENAELRKIKENLEREYKILYDRVENILK